MEFKNGDMAIGKAIAEVQEERKTLELEKKAVEAQFVALIKQIAEKEDKIAALKLQGKEHSAKSMRELKEAGLKMKEYPGEGGAPGSVVFGV